MNNLEIEFYSLAPEYTKDFPIQKSSAKIFKWVEELRNDYVKKIKEFPNGGFTHTSKCIGINSILKTGWVQTAYQDITIKTFGDKKTFLWESEYDQCKSKFGNIISDAVSFHTKQALHDFKNMPENTLQSVIKIQSPWFAKIPEGYSLLSMPVPYNDDTRFTAATGILTYNNHLNVQLYWHCLDSTEVIKKGTPLCQYILLKNESINFKIKDLESLEELKEMYPLYDEVIKENYEQN